MQTLFSELETAMEAEITPKVVDILVEIAKVSVCQNDKTYAAEILALALQYPMRVETLQEAEQLFSILETELYPSAIREAWEQTERMTLEDMVAHVLTKASE